MKIYIRATTENHTVFDETTTGSKYYDNYFTESGREYLKNRQNSIGDIIWMTPKEYFQECVNIFRRHNVSTDDLIRSRSDQYIDKYISDMKNGKKFPMCYIDYVNDSQDGLHRMISALKAFGDTIKYPVLIITPNDEHECWLDHMEYESSNYNSNEFPTMVSWMFKDLRDWDSPPPNNLNTVIEAYLINKAHEDGHTIDVKCEIVQIDGHLRINCYLLSYDGYEIPNPKRCREQPWVESMFDIKD